MAKSRSTSSPAVKKPAAARNQPTPDQIALRAYEIYLERGCEPGHELEDWTRAEHELSPKKSKPRQKAPAKPLAA